MSDGSDPGRKDRLEIHLTHASAVSVGVRVAGLGLAFVSHLVLSRILGANQYGHYMIALGWGMVLVIPCRMGLDNSVLRFATIYRDEAKSGDFRGLVVFSATSIAVVALAIVSIILLAKSAGFGPLAPVGWPLVAGLALLVPALAMLGWLSALIRTANRIFASQFYEQVLRPALLIALLGLAVVAGIGLDAGQAMILTGITVVIAMLGIGLHSWRLFADLLSTRASFDRRRDWLSVSWPLFLMAIVQELLNQVDLILLGIFSNATEAAHFAAACPAPKANCWLVQLSTSRRMAVATTQMPKAIADAASEETSRYRSTKRNNLSNGWAMEAIAGWPVSMARKGIIAATLIASAIAAAGIKTSNVASSRRRLSEMEPSITRSGLAAAGVTARLFQAARPNAQGLLHG